MLNGPCARNAPRQTNCFGAGHPLGSGTKIAIKVTKQVRAAGRRASHIADEGRMKRLVAASGVLLTLAACSVPFISHGGDKKSECDRMSAEAIQTQDIGKARELAAGASACYAKLAQ